MKTPKPTSIRMEFEDNGTLALLTGEHNANLAQLEQALDVSLDIFGNSITITGPVAETRKAQIFSPRTGGALNRDLYFHIPRGLVVVRGLVDSRLDH